MSVTQSRNLKEDRLLRAERTEIEGITVDYTLSHSAGGYSLRVESDRASEELSEYTDNPLLAEAFYLLVREERLLPGTLSDLWEEWRAEGAALPKRTNP